MSNKETGGPAFPNEGGAGNLWNDKGMTLRQYAAIKLKVPNSDTDWLDDMIRQSLRDDFAAKAMQGQLSRPTGSYLQEKEVANVAYMQADAMLKAGEA
jgi:hypothetical protein